MRQILHKHPACQNSVARDQQKKKQGTGAAHHATTSHLAAVWPELLVSWFSAACGCFASMLGSPNAPGWAVSGEVPAPLLHFPVPRGHLREQVRRQDPVGTASEHHVVRTPVKNHALSHRGAGVNIDDGVEFAAGAADDVVIALQSEILADKVDVISAHRLDALLLDERQR